MDDKNKALLSKGMGSLLFLARNLAYAMEAARVDALYASNLRELVIPSKMEEYEVQLEKTWNVWRTRKDELEDVFDTLFVLAKMYEKE